MKQKGIKDTPSTCTLLISAYTLADKYVEANDIF